MMVFNRVPASNSGLPDRAVKAAAPPVQFAPLNPWHHPIPRSARIGSIRTAGCGIVIHAGLRDANSCLQVAASVPRVPPVSGTGGKQLCMADRLTWQTTPAKSPVNTGKPLVMTQQSIGALITSQHMLGLPGLLYFFKAFKPQPVSPATTPPPASAQSTATPPHCPSAHRAWSHHSLAPYRAAPPPHVAAVAAILCHPRQ